jgi:1-acyl-sn-glycerol-3-phosphate acyltransferase
MSPRSGIPPLGDALPRSGGQFARAFGRAALGVLGWHFEGALPNVPKGVLIVAPHTSNWDWAIGIAGKLALGLNANWLGKHTLFRGPVGTIMGWLGGIPVDRTSSHDVVAQCVAQFAARDRMVLGLAPEGTRKAVERWRTGFYHIARGAHVPIIPVAFDWSRHAIMIGAATMPTGDIDADMDVLAGFFSNARGKRGELTPPPRPNSH